jgi:CubicO group peptidase (beta-lactamase class C family)
MKHVSRLRFALVLSSAIAIVSSPGRERTSENAALIIAVQFSRRPRLHAPLRVVASGFASLSAIATSMTRIPSIFAIALSLSVVAVGGGNAQSRDFDADLALFGRYVDALARQARIPGLSSAIVSGGQVVSLHAYGFQDIDSRVAATPDTLYDIASLTKTFASTLLMQCLERGTLTLDEPIRRYTPAIPETNATVRHVLSHTSQGTPGAEYRYDGNRYAALTDVIAACHGRPFRQALAVEILDRAAMTGSVPGHDLERPSTALAALFDGPTLARYASAIGRLATPYTTTGSGVARADFPPRDISASAGLLSSVVDLAKYDVAVDAHVFIAAETQQLDGPTPSRRRRGSGCRTGSGGSCSSTTGLG